MDSNHNRSNITDQPNFTANMTSLNYFTISLLGIVSIVGILENILILGVVGFRVQRTVISIWILNLAASDLLATSSLPFFTLYKALGDTWILGATFCRIYSSMYFLNMFVSAFLLTAISLDRCVMVLKPVWAQNHRNIQTVGKICAGIWVVAVICTIPFYMFRDTIPKEPGRILCYYNYNQFLPEKMHDKASLIKQRKQGLAFMKFFLAFLIPLLVIVLSYASVNIGLVRRGSKRSFRFVRLVIAVVVSFFVCWAPYHILIITEVMTSVGDHSNTFAIKYLPISATFSFVNSILNPVLYVFSCPDLCHKIRHSLGSVMETVLMEDLMDSVRRRSTLRSILSNSEYVMTPKRSIPNSTTLQTDEQSD